MVSPRHAVRGALWTVTGGFGARTITIVCNVALSRYLGPDLYGEVALASVVVLSASLLLSCGLGQYVVARRAPPSVVFQGTVLFVGTGVFALGLVVLLRNTLCSGFGAPAAAAYLPPLALAAMIDRVTFMPERVLVRDMRFGVVALSRSLGEIAFGAATVALAAAGYGGNSVVLASLLRSFLKLGVALVAVDLGEWARPHPIEKHTVRDFLRFGLPLNVAAIAEFGSRRWDNLLMSGLFGPGISGMYNYAYNLADIPATQIGESIGDVLVPSLAGMTPERRKAALLRALRLVVFVVCPLAIGLGAVAPTLVSVCFDARWAPIAPMLAVLAALSVVRPVAWLVAPYLQVTSRSRTAMALELAKTAFLLGAMWVLGSRLGPLWACAAPGLAFTFNALSNLWVIRRAEGISIRSIVRPLLPPLVACVPMVLAVLMVRSKLADLGPLPPFLALAIEVVTGAAAFSLAALLVAPALSRELVSVLRDALSRRRAGEPTVESAL